MRKNKIMFMAMIFIVSLLCISAVSAADDADLSDVIADTDTNDATVLEESIDDASISDSQSDENVLSDDGGASEPITEPALQRNFTALIWKPIISSTMMVLLFSLMVLRLNVL